MALSVHGKFSHIFMSKESVMFKKIITLVGVCCMAPCLAIADNQDCQARWETLNQSLSERYIELDKQCAKNDSETCSSDPADECNTMSAECKDLYEALSTEASKETEALAAECPLEVESVSTLGTSAALQKAAHRATVLGKRNQGLKKRLKKSEQKNARLEKQLRSTAWRLQQCRK